MIFVLFFEEHIFQGFSRAVETGSSLRSFKKSTEINQECEKFQIKFSTDFIQFRIPWKTFYLEKRENFNP
jgi:hypothetical protein